MSQVLLSGMQPSNHPTLGNYLGALKNWVKLQEQYDCFFMAVDLHSITTAHDPQTLREETYRMMASYIAAGISPEKNTLFVQSQVPEHAELAWVLTCYTYMGELNRMTQFKDKSERSGQNIPTGLFTYPTLMAADILLYQTNLVPVGKDQKQHLELTRDLAGRMNTKFGSDQKPLFKIPEPFIPPVGAKIMDLQDPTKKMSKSSQSDSGTVFLTDDEKKIMKKVKRAVTDSGSEIRFDENSQPGVSNLLTIQAVLTGESIESRVKAYEGKQYGHLKIETGEMIVENLRPLQEEMNRLLEDKAELDQILKKGALKAREKASQTLDHVYSSIGFFPRVSL